MATYNRADGTGGLDGSVQFEQDRPEVCICCVSSDKVKRVRVECWGEFPQFGPLLWSLCESLYVLRGYSSLCYHIRD
jgi:hypothetical protein